MWIMRSLLRAVYAVQPQRKRTRCVFLDGCFLMAATFRSNIDHLSVVFAVVLEAKPANGERLRIVIVMSLCVAAAYLTRSPTESTTAQRTTNGLTRLRLEWSICALTSLPTIPFFGWSILVSFVSGGANCFTMFPIVVHDALSVAIFAKI